MMEYETRSYQERDIPEIVTSFEHSQRVLYIAPPGSGKTYIYTSCIKNLNLPNNLVIVHRDELKKQIQQTISRSEILNTEVITIQEGNNNPLKKYDLIVIDEVHHYVHLWKKIAESFRHKKTLVLGVTATPERSDGININRYFQKIIYGPEIPELQKNNWLANFTIITPNWEKVRIIDYDHPIILNDEIAGWPQFDNFQLENLGTISEIYTKYLDPKPAFAFVKSIKIVDEKVRELNNNGIPALGISHHSKNRAAILKKFSDREIKVLVSVDLLNDGIDMPFVKGLILLRRTKSFTLWEQQLGRAFRPFNQEKAIIIDAVGNAANFGLNPKPAPVFYPYLRRDTGQLNNQLSEPCA